MRIFAVVVTYRRPKMLERTLENLFCQTLPPSKTVVIDNSEDEQITERNREVAEKFENVLYVRMPENAGSAGGYRRGMEIAFLEGAQKIFTSDDDTTYTTDTIKELSLWLEKLDAGAVRCAWEGYEGGVREVESSVWTGVMISWQAVAKAGLPDPSFFLYGDDEEYFLRIKKAGFKMYIIPSARYTSRPAQHKKRFKLAFISSTTYPDPLRMYYAVRNEVFIKTRFNRKRLPKIFAYVLKTSVAISSNPCLLLSLWKGVADGILGKLGKRHKAPCTKFSGIKQSG